MKTIMVSGGFDPLHVGHINLLNEAAEYGRVLVALNTDDWLVRKKGYAVMTWNDRAQILRALCAVDRVVQTKDDDGTVCWALEGFQPTFFANGGDRQTADPLERATCERLGIIQLFNVGGAKIASSTALIENPLRRVEAAIA